MGTMFINDSPQLTSENREPQFEEEYLQTEFLRKPTNRLTVKPYTALFFGRKRKTAATKTQKPQVSQI